MSKDLYWIWLSLSCTPGSQSFIKLWERFGEVSEIFSLGEEDIKSVLGSRASDVRALSDKSLVLAKRVLDFCDRHGVGIVKFTDQEYPASLREIKNPPVLLYYRGILPSFNSAFPVSVVGTRRLTEYGKRNAFEISYDLSLAGATVVSGMAIGIDGVALAGAIAAGGVTVAVIGSGINVCYPKEHLTLAREIVKRGCVLTEYPPNTRPEKHNFPTRNRIISALSRVTLVIEGKEKSGALITARLAKEQGRPVYAIPGNVGNKTSELTNLLIKNGASLCRGADDIINDFLDSSLGVLNPFKLTDSVRPDINESLSSVSVSAVTQDDGIFSRFKKRRTENTQKREAVPEEKSNESLSDKLSGFDKDTVKLYSKIPLEGDCSVESLVDSELPIRTVMRGLLKLEMGRFVEMLPGERVRRKS